MRDDLMVQQQVNGAWQHMVAVICLNQNPTSFSKQFFIHYVLIKSPHFFSRVSCRTFVEHFHTWKSSCFVLIFKLKVENPFWTYSYKKTYY